MRPKLFVRLFWGESVRALLRHKLRTILTGLGIMIGVAAVIWVVVFDVDHFKQVNDRFGHGVGDAVLRGVAETLAAQGRLTDTVGRWGGEEFVAVLGGLLGGARAFCERARRAIERMTCPPIERITISVGLVEVAVGEAPADAVARADKRLYEAKIAGRNRLAV